MKQKFYQVTVNNRVADINIYGDITSWKWLESDVTSFDIKKEIDALDVDEINVYINSYGGEVAEALAIYSTLVRNKAKVHTFCDGFACSAASIVFCAGDERTISDVALLMIHNCMSYLGYANAAEMRKAAEDNEKINNSSVEAYKAVTNLSEEQIRDLMDAETWLTAQECIDYGFATDITKRVEEEGAPQQSAFMALRNAILNRGNAAQVAAQEGTETTIPAEPVADPEEPEPANPDQEPMPEEPEQADPEPKPENKFLKFIKKFTEE